jgi:hypothetical protein
MTLALLALHVDPHRLNIQQRDHLLPNAHRNCGSIFLYRYAQ